jgi:hypothetical protein
MALLAPLLFALIFGIVDMGYYVWGYVTIYSAARDASEKAAMVPPFPETLAYLYDTGNPGQRLEWQKDPCTREIVEQATILATDQFPVDSQRITIRYAPGPADQQRRVGRPIEVIVEHEIEPLTPLVQFIQAELGNNGVMSVRAVSQRTIEALGQSPDPRYAPRGGVACALPSDF